MSEQEPQEYVEPEEGPSLRDRMAARAEALSHQRTGRFAVPGYDGVLEVELRTLGFHQVRHIVERVKGVRDVADRELYAMVDNLVAATVGFYEVYPNGKPARPLDDTWVSLAERLPLCPENPTPRQAVIFLCGDDRVMFLIQEWSAWQREGRDEVDEEVGRDFSPTG